MKQRREMKRLGAISILIILVILLGSLLVSCQGQPELAPMPTPTPVPIKPSPPPAPPKQPSQTPTLKAPETVFFPDGDLESIIRTAINKPEGDISTSDLEGITSLNVWGANITDLSGLEYCTNLTELYLPDSQISDISPLSSLTNLTKLSLYQNQLSDISPLSFLTSLTELDLPHNQISDISPLSSLTSLTELYLTDNQISDISPLSFLTSLTKLYLSENQISDISPLSSLTNLTELSISFNQISDISPLSSLTSLTELSISSNQISDISVLSSLTNVTTLYLSDNPIKPVPLPPPSPKPPPVPASDNDTRISAPALEWRQTFGYVGYGQSVCQTSDGGYIITGYNLGDHDIDACLIKTDANGNETWSKTFGESGIVDEGYSVCQTTDGGYIIVGDTGAPYREPTLYPLPYPPDADPGVWLIKTDSRGNETWSRTLGGSGWDYGRSVCRTSDGGYAITGYSNSYSVDNFDVLLIKTDADGNETWSQTFGGSSWDSGESVCQTADGGYIIAGYTLSYGAGQIDILLIKTDAAGNETWSKTFGGSLVDKGYSVCQTIDGGYIVVGSKESYGVTARTDVWLLKIDANGNETWNQTFNGSSADCGYSVCQTTDGGYIIVGSLRTHDIYESDIWIIKTDADGKETWSQTFGGNGDDCAYSVRQTTDGGYIITGQVSSHILLLKYGADKEVSYEQGDKEVDFEQLFANPEAYNGRDITIEGFYFQGWEVITLREGLEYFNGHMNGSGRSMWIDGGVPREIYDEAYEQQVASQLQRYAKVRIKGMFEYGSRYGHCGGWSANIVPSEVVLLPWSPQVE